MGPEWFVGAAGGLSAGWFAFWGSSLRRRGVGRPAEGNLDASCLLGCEARMIVRCWGDVPLVKSVASLAFSDLGRQPVIARGR